MERCTEGERRGHDDWNSGSEGDNVSGWIMDGYSEAKKQLSAVIGSSGSGV